jgi:hypothetical protein
MSDKYLPNLTETDSLNDDDLLYVTGVSTGDFAVKSKNLRVVLKPLPPSVQKTLSYTVTAEDCDGRWFSNQGSLSSVEFSLPESADGLSICFLVSSAKNLVITPRLTDRIVNLAFMDGQSVRCKTVGASICLRSTDHNWYVTSNSGTWAAV